MEVLELLGKGLATVEYLRDVRGVGARKLKEDMGSRGEERGPHLRRQLIQELICRDEPGARLTRFCEYRLNLTALGHEVLDLVTVETA